MFPIFRHSSSIEMVFNAIFLFFFVVYFFVPLHSDASTQVFSSFVLLYLVATFCFFSIVKKTNYFDFDTIFILVCSIIHLAVGFYMNSEDLDKIMFFSFENSVLLKGSVVAILGLLSYMKGSMIASRHAPMQLSKEPKQYFRIGRKLRNYLDFKIIFISFFFCAAIFYITGGFDFFEDQYQVGVGVTAGSGLMFQSITLMSVFSNLLCVSVFFDYLRGKKIHVSKFAYIALVLSFAVLLAAVGNRTLFSYILLPYIMCLARFVKPLNIRLTALAIVVGIIMMYVVQVTRNGGDQFSNSLIFVISDLIIPSDVYYKSFLYVEEFGYNFGKTLLPSFFGLIPGLSSFLGSWSAVGSAELMTKYLAEGTHVTSGLGTTILADLYLSFGMPGVVFFMCLLGKFVNTIKKNPNFDLIITIGMFSCCVFMCRSGYFLPLRLITWCLFFYWLFKQVYLWKQKKSVSSSAN